MVVPESNQRISLRPLHGEVDSSGLRGKIASLVRAVTAPSRSGPQLSELSSTLALKKGQFVYSARRSPALGLKSRNTANCGVP